MTLLNSECSVTSFFPEDRPDIIKQLSETVYEHVNYDGLDWFQFDCVSILQNGDDIVGFSSIWHRPEYYEKGEVRILNRYWENQELRRIGRELARSHIISACSGFSVVILALFVFHSDTNRSQIQFSFGASVKIFIIKIPLCIF